MAKETIKIKLKNSKPNKIRTALQVPQVNVRQATITKQVPTKRAQQRRSFFSIKVAHSNVTKREDF